MSPAQLLLVLLLVTDWHASEPAGYTAAVIWDKDRLLLRRESQQVSRWPAARAGCGWGKGRPGVAAGPCSVPRLLLSPSLCPPLAASGNV